MPLSERRSVNKLGGHQALVTLFGAGFREFLDLRPSLIFSHQIPILR